MPTVSLAQAIELAAQYVQQGRLDQGEATCQAILQAHPNEHRIVHLLGLIAHQRNDHVRALELIDKAIASEPDATDYHSNRGTVLMAMNRLDEAVAEFSRALEIKPDFADARFNLAKALMLQGRLDDAIAHLEKLVREVPQSPLVQATLGDVLWKQGKFAESVPSYRRAVELDPSYVYAWVNMGFALQGCAQFDAAIACFRTAHQIDAKSAIAVRATGNVLQEQGQLDAAINCYRQAIEIDPTDATAQAALLGALIASPRATPKVIGEEYERWSRRLAEPLMRAIHPHPNSRDPDRRLRVGYVSPDFYKHPIHFFLEPLLANHDHAQVEVHCYASVQRPDAVTARFQAKSDVWHDVVGLSDAELSEKIRADGIDLLIDLTLHSSNNRMLLFARKPAPVQTTWLAYAGTSGLATIDYRITDRFIEPPDMDFSWESERAFHLPDCWCCYQADMEIQVNELPSLKSGAITFGSLSAFRKISQPVLELWARVLKAIADSRLVMVCPDGSHRQSLLDYFQSQGVAAPRIQLYIRQRRTEFLQLHNQIDIALDPFPWSGNATSCDSLWMGVPILTRPGELPVSRQTYSLLANLGLHEQWAARSVDHFVQLACERAGDLSKLAELRASLRQRMRTSPIMDAPRFAKNMEAAYRAMWRRWCM